MAHLSRRAFVQSASAAAALTASSSLVSAAVPRHRVLVGSGGTEGILSFDWDSATGTLTPAGTAAKLDVVDWLTTSPDGKYLFVACEVDSFRGKPTGEVASFQINGTALEPLSAENSAAKGTCHIALDRTGRVLVSADYGGGSAASFLVTDGKLTPVWTEHYSGHGPKTDRQESAHAHFASFSPDNRFAYINDLGSDAIHIYHLDTASAQLTPAGTYHAVPGSGPRTLHFHPNGRTAYSVNELVSTVDVLTWNPADGSLSRQISIELLPADYKGPTRACDTAIARDGRFVYFANRDSDFLYSFMADPKTGALVPMKRSNCGGKIPRNFTLDPTERWMLVANQDSNRISVFARDPKTGLLADTGKDFSVPIPMRILFV